MPATHLSLCDHTTKVRPTTPKPRHVQIAGDLASGTLLAQIDFWFQPTKCGRKKVRVQRRGCFWVAKTRDAWMAETGLGAAQYKRAISVLKHKGFIEVQRMRFGGLAISHIRLLPAYYAAVQQSALAEGRESTDRSGGFRSIGLVFSAPSGTETTTETTDRDHEHRSCEDARARADMVGDHDRERSEWKEGEDGKDWGTTRDVTDDPKDVPHVGAEDSLDDIEELLATPLASSQTTEPRSAPVPWPNVAVDGAITPNSAGSPTEASGGAGYWVAHLPSGEYHKPLTGKERGQLKQLQKYLGPQTEPVIAYVFEHWWRFASRAGAESGTSWPASPHIGFLLKHHGVAVNLFAGTVTSQPVTTSKVTCSAPVVPALPKPVKEAPYVPSLDEIQAMIADLKQT